MYVFLTEIEKKRNQFSLKENTALILKSCPILNINVFCI